MGRIENWLERVPVWVIPACMIVIAVQPLVFDRDFHFCYIHAVLWIALSTAQLIRSLALHRRLEKLRASRSNDG